MKHVFVVQTSTEITEGMHKDHASTQEMMVNMLEALAHMDSLNVLVASHVNQPDDQPLIIPNNNEV